VSSRRGRPARRQTKSESFVQGVAPGPPGGGPPLRGTRWPRAAPPRGLYSRAALASEEAALARAAAAVEAKRAALEHQKATPARNEATPTTATPEDPAGVAQERAELKAQETERGLVLTLSDVLFAPDEAKLTAGAVRKLELFTLHSVLPLGTSFPYDFGFFPSTLGGDGDPLDVLIFMDEPALVGSLIPCHVVGVIEAEQTEKHKTERNDRLPAVALHTRRYRECRALKDLSPQVLDEIERFFAFYNRQKGVTFTPIGRHGPGRAAYCRGREALQTSTEKRRGVVLPPAEAGTGLVIRSLPPPRLGLGGDGPFSVILKQRAKAALFAHRRG
jgi:inorganic pyrophosphatase